MDQNTDLFVQAFWVKCRETIRPEIDATVRDLRGAGHDAAVSTQEFSPPDTLPAPAGPSVMLAIRPSNLPEDAIHPMIEFHGDVVLQVVEVRAGHGHTQSYDLAALGTDEVKAEIEEWLSRLAAAAPV